jgi:SAM-dependent methyltransferase
VIEMTAEHQQRLREYAVDTGFSLRRCYVDLFYAEEMKRLADASRVLDLGGVRKKSMPGRFDVASFSLDVVCLNILPSANPHVIATAEALPFGGETFDAVICSEVLEHTRDPRVVLAEASRVLKPGGRLLIAVPFLYQIHASPHDFGRYTDFFWLTVLENLGFVVERLEKQGLYWSVILDFVRLPIDRAASETRSTILRKFLRAVLRWPLAWARVWAVRAEGRATMQQHPTFSNFTTGYGIVAYRNPAV